MLANCGWRILAHDCQAIVYVTSLVTNHSISVSLLTNHECSQFRVLSEFGHSHNHQSYHIDAIYVLVTLFEIVPYCFTTLEEVRKNWATGSGSHYFCSFSSSNTFMTHKPFVSVIKGRQIAKPFIWNQTVWQPQGNVPRLLFREWKFVSSDLSRSLLIFNSMFFNGMTNSTTFVLPKLLLQNSRVYSI